MAETLALILSIVALLVALKPELFMDPLIDAYDLSIRPLFTRSTKRKENG